MFTRSSAGTATTRAEAAMTTSRFAPYAAWDSRTEKLGERSPSWSSAARLPNHRPSKHCFATRFLFWHDEPKGLPTLAVRLGAFVLKG
jgi:hypothetical protein